MNKDPHALTDAETLAVAELLEAAKDGRDDDARWWAEQPSVLAALEKMRAKASKEAS